MTRRTFFSLLSAAAAPGAARPPNIVFIMLDDLGYADAGCFGQKTILTFNIDRLAAQGTRFTDCYAGSTVCAPSRSVLMTGLHSGHSPVRANAGTVPLRASDVTLAQVLKHAGYATGGFGKWGLGDAGSDGVPAKHGFDEFFGYLHQIHAHDYYPEFLRDGERKHPLPGNANGQRLQYSADAIAERALKFIHAHKDKPFFLYAAYTLPHAKFEPPGTEPYSAKDWPDPAKKYAAMVTRGDKHVGDILRTLTELKLDGDTVVFFTSDNGGTGAGKFFNNNGPFRANKGSLYEGGIRVPLIVRWNGRVAPGAVSGFPCSFCDMMPTFAEIAGVKPPPKLDGISLLPAILGRKSQPRRPLYWEIHQFDRKSNDLKKGSMMQAARLGNWKAVRPEQTAPTELYDLGSDIGESKNVAGQHPEVVRKMDTFMRAAHMPPRPHNTGNFEYVR